MSPSEFRAWRKSQGLRQKEAAEKLGLKKRMIQYYETGNRGEKKVVIPKTVELACYALTVGVEAFDGAAAANGRPDEAEADTEAGATITDLTDKRRNAA
jgi:transcriptional regulator with XRE-family HTH domain